jgi:hypothetical protein
MENIQSQELRTLRKGATDHCNTMGQGSAYQEALHSRLPVADRRMMQVAG